MAPRSLPVHQIGPWRERWVSTTQIPCRSPAIVAPGMLQRISRADQLDADLIVVGDRGRSKIKRMLLGSVSDRVVRHADRAVMVVR
ncbi:MAG TPA: universal stress protein [Pseudomonadales bacterium]|nr:universal stress protein [Pseudomonadales bacterium]